MTLESKKKSIDYHLSELQVKVQEAKLSLGWPTILPKIVGVT